MPFFKKKSPPPKIRTDLILLGLMGIVLLLIFSSLYLWAALEVPAGGGPKEEFIVQKGESVQSISVRLEKEGLVRSAFIFRTYVKLKRLATQIQAGRYEISPDLNIKQVAQLLRHGTFDLALTFLEGWRREEFAEYAASKLSSPTEEFKEDFLAQTEGLEGYLFPDTYIAPVDVTAKKLGEILKSNFEKKYQENIAPRASSRGLKKEEVVILASLVERESFGEKNESEIIAGILIKRWRSGWRLDVDATIQYALGYQEDSGEWWKDNLTSEDIKAESPYNTYKYKGLPPAPISNPGLSALLAVANYQESPYWFYLHDKEGQVHFAKTLEEHNQNRKEYLPQ